MSLTLQIKNALNAAVPSLFHSKYAPAKLHESAAELIQIAVENGVATTDHVVERDVEVVNIWAVKTTATGVGSAKTATVSKNGDDITNAMDIAVAANVLVRPSSFNVANTTFAAGDKLRVEVSTTAQDSSCIVFVEARRL